MDFLIKSFLNNKYYLLFFSTICKPNSGGREGWNL